MIVCVLDDLLFSVKISTVAKAVGADVYYPMPVHRQSYIEALGLGADLPVTDRAAARTMALPIYPGLTESDQAQVIDVVRSAVLRLADPSRE